MSMTNSEFDEYYAQIKVAQGAHRQAELSVARAVQAAFIPGMRVFYKRGKQELCGDVEGVETTHCAEAHPHGEPLDHGSRDHRRGIEVSTPADTINYIRVWRFWEAPDELRALSGHGGDEDWLALVPPDMGYVSWLESGSFGGCDISKHDHDKYPGYEIYIGAHS